MRDIKFRGKRIDDGKWFYGLYLHNEFNGEYGIGIPGEPIFDQIKVIKVEEHTIGQYTGLHDKNGVEIYEGDIVKTVVIKQNRNTEDEVEEKIMPVVFEKAEFLLKDNTTAFGPTFHHLRLCKSIEVIGNIHDNPELLKGE